MKNPSKSNHNVANLHGDRNKVTNLNLTINDVAPLFQKIEEQEAVINEQKGYIFLLSEILTDTWKNIK